MTSGIVKEYYDFLRLVVDHGASPVLIVDEANVIQMTNPAADRFFSASASELAGRPFPFPVDGKRLPAERTVEAEDGSWTADMQVEPVDRNGRRFYVVSLRDTTEKKALLNGLIEETRLNDPLTGLLNAKGFRILAEQQVKLTRRTGQGFILMLVSLDNLRSIRAIQGVKSRDTALCEAGRLIRETFRDTDLVARLAADEFAMAALDAHRESGGILVARLRDALWSFNAHSSDGYQLSISTGLAGLNPAKPCALDELIKQARIDLEGCKKQKGRISSSA